MLAMANMVPALRNPSLFKDEHVYFRKTRYLNQRDKNWLDCLSNEVMEWAYKTWLKFSWLYLQNHLPVYFCTICWHSPIISNEFSLLGCYSWSLLESWNNNSCLLFPQVWDPWKKAQSRRSARRSKIEAMSWHAHEEVMRFLIYMDVL